MNMIAENENSIIGMCSCGKPLYPSIFNGNRIGVHHTLDDEDFHLEYYSNDNLNSRIIEEFDRLKKFPDKEFDYGMN